MMIAALLLAAAPVAAASSGVPAPQKFPDDAVLQALSDEVARAMTLKMPAQAGEKKEPDRPYYVRAYINTDSTFGVWANFGAQYAPSAGQSVKIGTAVHVGTAD